MLATVHALDTTAHRQGRIARRCPFVVWIEGADGRWFEMDATDNGHADALAENWIRPELGARGCSTRRVNLTTGKTRMLRLVTPPIAWPDDEEAA